jgi:hypothetical protein
VSNHAQVKQGDVMIIREENVAGMGIGVEK